MIALPVQTRIMPQMTLAARYNALIVQFPLLPSTHMSFAKVEKVVKPPQKPVIRSKFSSGVIMWCFSIIPKNSPIRKQPKRLTMNVLIGKDP